MKQELNFFTDRIGYTIYRTAAMPKNTGVILVTSAKHAQELYNDQEKYEHTFTKCGELHANQYKVRVTVDGRRIKCKDFQMALDVIKAENLTLSNPEEFPEFYQNKYSSLITGRNSQ